jgi:3-phytase
VGPQLTADVEGIAIYRGKPGQSDYLVISSQGSNSYVVLDATPPYRVRGAFRVGYNLDAGIDGTSETDGLDVTSAALGAAYPDGMLAIQDGYKRLPDGTQNFKYVSWTEVAKVLGLGR